jgi:hypothetical protein
LDRNKLQSWLKVISGERLRWEHETLKSKLVKAYLALWGNIITALFTVPATVGIAVVVHYGAHCWAQAKCINYNTQLQSFNAELKRRGM